MLKKATGSVVTLALLIAAAGVAFVVAMRKKYPPVQDLVRRMNREVMNPQQMETAGQPGAYASIIHHVGRTTGAAHQTPVQAQPTEDGFVIPLPYGRSPDWLKNVLAETTAKITHEGTVYEVGEPRFVPSDAAERYVPAKDLKTQQLFGVDEFLRVQTVESSEEAEKTEASA